MMTVAASFAFWLQLIFIFMILPVLILIGIILDCKMVGHFFDPNRRFDLNIRTKIESSSSWDMPFKMPKMPERKKKYDMGEFNQS